MKYSIEEVNFLLKYYISYGAKYCASILNRSPSQICKKAMRLKIKVDRKQMVSNNPEFLKYLKEHAKKTIQPINEKNKIVLDKIEIENLYASGKSIQDIAIIYSCSTQPIKKILKYIPKRRAWDSPKHRSKNQYGKNNSSWKGGIKNIYDRFRDLTKYYNWRKEVLNRDGNKCTSCTDISKLHCHHIKTLKSLILEYCVTNNKEIKDLTREDLLNSFFYELANGITLCETCHKKWHKEHGR